MKHLHSIPALLTCLVILVGCAAPDYSDPDKVAEEYVRSVIAKDGSHTSLELTEINPELQSYCNLGLSSDWKTNMPSSVNFVERLEATNKGKGNTEDFNDYIFGLTGKGPFTTSNLITYLVELQFADGDGKEYTASIALRPEHGHQPMTKGRIFDWKDVEWKVVPL